MYVAYKQQKPIYVHTYIHKHILSNLAQQPRPAAVEYKITAKISSPHKCLSHTVINTVPSVKKNYYKIINLRKLYNGIS